MHTENLEASQLIRAAVVAQLAKPAIEPSAVALLTKGFKWELLTWWGIIGGAVTLFVAISATLKLADWARVLVENWNPWTHAFWLWVFGWLGIHLARQMTTMLSFLLFLSLLIICQAIQFKRTTRNQTNGDKYQTKSVQFISWQTLVVLIVMLVVVFGLLDTWIVNFVWYDVVIFGAIVLTVIYVPPVAIIVLLVRHKLHADVSTVLVLVFFVIITVMPIVSYIMQHGHRPEPPPDWYPLVFAVVIWISPLILLSVAPAKAVSRRLIFLALGLLLLIALNELSKLGLDVTAPKLQG